MELRWNPKPAICFKRKGVGTILVVGKEILQFDATFKLLFRKEVKTFYQGVQEAMLMVGATVSDIIKEDEPQIDSGVQDTLNDAKD